MAPYADRYQNAANQPQYTRHTPGFTWFQEAVPDRKQRHLLISLWKSETGGYAMA